MGIENISGLKFVAIAVKLLKMQFIDETASDMEDVYKLIYQGYQSYLTKVKMKPGKNIRFGVSLEHDNYNGELSFAAFHSDVLLLIANLEQAVKDGKVEVITYGEGEIEGASDKMVNLCSMSVTEGSMNGLFLVYTLLPKESIAALRLYYGEVYGEGATATVMP